MDQKIESILNIRTLKENIDPEQMDAFDVDRFNVENFTMPKYKFQNFYAFKIFNPKSTTGYSGMFINKEFYKKVKAAHDEWLKNKTNI